MYTIRLQTTGKRDKTHFRIIATEKRTNRNCKAKVLGYINNENTPVKIKADQEKIKDLINKGAVPSLAVRKFLSL